MNTEAYVEGVVIDICSRSFLLISDQEEERLIQCDSPEEFMNVMEVCTSHLNDDQIQYADLSVKGNKV
jgi:hypothetical protein